AAGEQAVALYRDLADVHPEAFRPDLARSLNNLSTQLSNLGRREEALAAGEDAISIMRELSRAFPGAYADTLGQSLAFARIIQSGARSFQSETHASDSLIELSLSTLRTFGQADRQAFNAVWQGGAHTDLGIRERLLEQVQARLDRFAIDRSPATVLDPEAVAEVAALLSTVVEPAGNLEIARVAGWLHWARYLVLPVGEDQEDLAAAVALFAPVYLAHADMVPDRVRVYFDDQWHSAAADTPDALAGRAVALLHETMRTGDRPALNDAIDLLRQAVGASPADDLDRAGPLSNLGAALRTRFARAGQIADLDAAIAAGRAAVNVVPPDHPDRTGYLSNLGAALATRFAWGGQLADLDEAISAGRAAVDVTPPHHPDRAAIVGNLSAVLQARFERVGSFADLDEAINAGRAAVDGTPPHHPDRAGYLSNLGAALATRFERVGSFADLDEAINAGRAAVDGTP
ncbi:tetratricopeptide repeat protein, partial [Frankia sp. Ag45/Mut15]